MPRLCTVIKQAVKFQILARAKCKSSFNDNSEPREARPNRLIKDAFIGSASNHNTITPSSRDTENVPAHKYKLIHLERATDGRDRRLTEAST